MGFYFYETPRVIKSVETGSRIWLPGAVHRVGNQCLTKMELQFGEMKKFWGWMVVMAAQRREYTY